MTERADRRGCLVRDRQVLASPRPDFRFQAEDVVVVVGTPENTAAVGELLRSGWRAPRPYA